MRTDFYPSSRHRFILLYDAATLTADFPIDRDLETAEPTPPPHKTIREMARDGLAFVVEVASEEDCEASFRVFLDESASSDLRQKGKLVATKSVLHVPSGMLSATGSEFMCLPGQIRKNVDQSPTANIPPGDYLITVYELVRWKAKNRRIEIRAQTAPLGRLVDTITQAFGIACAVLLVAHVLVAPITLLIVWQHHGWQAALKIGGIIAAMDALVYLLILLLALLEKKFDVFKVAEIRKQFDEQHPDFVIELEKADGRSGSGEATLFKWPRL